VRFDTLRAAIENHKGAHVADLTERNIERWDALFRSRSWGRYPPEELVRFTARTFPDPDTRRQLRALEVGCGPGANLWFLAREGFSVAGIDGSSAAIKTALERLQAEVLDKAKQQADLRVGNFAVLPWRDNEFDFVTDIEALYANPLAVIRSAIAEIQRVLKPGGWFFGKMFGPETTGITSGQQLEPGTTENPNQGRLQGLGIAHAFGEDEIRHEFASFSELHLDWVRRSDQGGAYHVFEWLVQARK
jgi:SAM-dependent methyltransferase